MGKYLYLTEQSWADTWVNGGRVPLSLASTYKSLEREGTNTPDETLMVKTNRDPRDIPSVFFSENLQFKNLNFHGNVAFGVAAPNVTGDRFIDDGIILSLSNVKSSAICQRLHKATCVRILDFQNLKTTIDSQLGVEGMALSCKYTKGHNRNHFLKSTMDKWQKEFRIFWRYRTPVWVELPPGIAVRTEI
jgi:hypothetical protein